MKRLFFRVLLAVFVLSVSIAGINVTRASSYDGSSTQVGGVIWEDTTWTLENSPYIITETVQIPEDVTLTIEPGVTIIRPTPGDMFLVCGRIEAHGTVVNKIIFDGGGNSNFFYAYGSAETPAYVILSYCRIKNGRSLLPTNGYDRLNLTHCEIIDVCEPCCPHAPAFIKYNLFIHWCSFVVGTSEYESDKIYIMNNLFLGRSSFSDEYYTVKCIGHGLVIKYNTFLGNNQVLQVYPGAKSVEIDATENYWGTNDTDIIDSMIYDKDDDIRCAGFIEYLPILTEPHPDTPKLPIMADFAFSPSTIYAGVTVTFNASVSYAPYGSIANYTWDFGDGNFTTSNTPVIKHTYAVPGNYDVTLTVEDEFGFENSTTKSLAVIEDNVSPITSDDYDGEWRNRDFAITLTAVDNESGVAEIYYRINDGPVKAVSVDGQPLIATEGANNTLEYWSVDKAGNEELSHKILTGIKLDKTPPSSSIVKSGNVRENGWFISDVTVTITATDNISGIRRIEYSFDNISWIEYDDPIIVTTEGYLTIYYRAMDVAGNMEDLKSELIKLDKTPPTIQLLYPSSGEQVKSSTITVRWSGSDEISGISHYEISLDEGSWVNVGTITSHIFSELTDGSHTIIIKAIDAAGNEKQDKVNFTVNTSLIGGPGWIDDIIVLGGIVTAMFVVVLIILKRRVIET